MSQRVCPVCGSPKRRMVGTMSDYRHYCCTNEECERYSDLPAPATHARPVQTELSDFGVVA